MDVLDSVFDGLTSLFRLTKGKNTMKVLGLFLQNYVFTACFLFKSKLSVLSLYKYFRPKNTSLGMFIALVILASLGMAAGLGSHVYHVVNEAVYANLGLGLSLALGMFFQRVLGKSQDVTNAPKIDQAFLVEDPLIASCIIQDNVFKYVNDRFAGIYGYSEAELLGKYAIEIIAPESRPCFRRIIGTILSGDNIKCVEQLEGFTKTGENFETEACFYRIQYKNRSAVLLKQIELKSQKHIQSAIDRNEQQYQQLIESHPDAIFIHSEGVIEFANPAAAQLLGISSQEEIVGLSYLDFVHPDYQESAQERMRIVFQSNLRSSVIEQRTKRADGSILEVEVIDLPFTFHGRPAIQTIMRDIREKKETENLFKGQKQILENIARGDSLPEILKQLTLFIEKHCSVLTCAFLLKNNNEERLHIIAAPHLPLSYQKMIDGIEISPKSECCGTAASIGEMVSVADITNAEGWEKFRDKARKNNIRSGWAMPVFSRQGVVLGVFSMYCNRVYSPTLWELQILEIAIDIAGIALESRFEEMARIESEHRYEHLLNSINDALFIYQMVDDDELKPFLNVNDIVCKKLQYSREEMLGMTIADIIPADAEGNVENLVKNLRQSQQKSFETVFQSKSGHTIPFEINSYWFESNGEMTILSLARDISVRKVNEIIRRESEERFRTIFDQSGIGIALVRLDGHIIESNSALQKMLNYRSEELQFMNITDIMISDDNRLNINEIAKYLQTIDGSLQTENRFVRRDGGGLWTRMTISLVKYQNRNSQFAIVMIEDISEKVNALQALKDSEDKFRVLFNSGMDAVFVFRIGKNNEPSSYIEINDVASAQLGYSRKALLKMPFIQHVDPILKKDFLKTLDKVFSDQHAVFETVLMKKNGKKIPVEMGVHIFNFQGKPAIIAVARDISDRQKAKVALGESERRYRGLFEGIPLGLYRSTPEGQFLDVNPALLAMLGLKNKDEAYKTNSIVFYTSIEDREKWLKILTEDGIVRSFDTQLRRKDGKIIWARINCSAVYDGKGKIVYIEGSIEDVTTRRQIEAALAAEKERLGVTLRSIGDGVITTNLEGKITLINEVAEKLTGWTGTPPLGEPIQQIFIARDNSREGLYNPTSEVLETAKPVIREKGVVLISRGGEKRQIAISAAPLKDDQDHLMGTVLVFRDVSKLFELEEELYKARKLESLGILAGGIAHDFNNILTAIIGNVSLAKVACSKDKKLLTQLDNAENAAERAKSLTLQLLTFAKGGSPVKKAASISEIIKETADFTIRGKRSICKYHFEENLWPVEVDEGQISQVINNLILNSVQAMPKGGRIKISAENVEITDENQEWEVLLKKGKYVRIHIQDNGVGIPQELLPQIFDPYFSTKKKGSGLGLAVSYSIIQKHGGYIFAESNPGKGTTFTILLPGSPEAVIHKSLRRLHIPTGRGKILVMDDEEAILELVGKMLVFLGYDVQLSHDGDEAIEVYKKALKNNSPFDAVIMDLTVPGGLGGKDTLQELLRVDPQIRAIVSSGYSTDPIMAQYRDFGFIDRISKPYDVQKMSEVLHRVLSKQVTDVTRSS